MEFGDNFTEVDPAADFIKREQNELAGLEDDLSTGFVNNASEGKLCRTHTLNGFMQYSISN